MTDKLDSQSRADLINYKIEKAFCTLSEADLLAGSEFYNAAVNRLYYSAYYAASALMLTEYLDAATHKGIKLMLGLKFISTGKLDRVYGQIYQKLFDGRQAGDYEDFVYFDKQTFDTLRPEAEDFINEVTRLISSSRNLSSK